MGKFNKKDDLLTACRQVDRMNSNLHTNRTQALHICAGIWPACLYRAAVNGLTMKAEDAAILPSSVFFGRWQRLFFGRGGEHEPGNDRRVGLRKPI